MCHRDDFDFISELLLVWPNAMATEQIIINTRCVRWMNSFLIHKLTLDVHFIVNTWALVHQISIHSFTVRCVQASHHIHGFRRISNKITNWMDNRFFGRWRTFSALIFDVFCMNRWSLVELKNGMWNCCRIKMDGMHWLLYSYFIRFRSCIIYLSLKLIIIWFRMIQKSALFW